MHDGQVAVSVATARSLVREQFPAWAGLALRPLTTTGTVNSVLRLGGELAVRFPLVRQDPARVRRSLEVEAAASSEFASVSPFPAPRPVAIGDPGHGFPMPWSVQTWLPGRDALRDDRRTARGSRRISRGC